MCLHYRSVPRPGLLSPCEARLAGGVVERWLRLACSVQFSSIQFQLLESAQQNKT